MKKTLIALSIAVTAVTAQADVSEYGQTYTANAVASANAEQVTATSTVTALGFADAEKVRAGLQTTGVVTQAEVEANLIEAKFVGTDYANIAKANIIAVDAKNIDTYNINGNTASLESLTMRNGKITDLAAGKADTDAVNVSQLKAGMTEAKAYSDAGDVVIQNQLNAVDADLQGVKTDVAGVANDIKTVAGRVDTHEARLDALDASQVAQDAEIAKLSTSVAGASNDANTALAGVSANAQAIKATQTAVKANSTAIANQATATKTAIAKASAQANSKIRALRDLMRERDNKLRKGIAGAIAHANLPQAVKAGGSTLGVAGGYYADKTAIAVGYSRMSNNAKHTIKVSVGYDGAYVNAGAGYGYNW